MTHAIPPSVRVLLDFDGTITTTDSVDAILERFALPQWHAVEEEWEKGLIGSLDCLQRQVALIRATPEALNSFIDQIEIDPAFHDLLSLCADHALPVGIVSDGFEWSVHRVLQRLGVSCQVKANLLAHTGDDRWALAHPYAHAGCTSGAGTCKCRAAGSASTILIGDGRSDFCVAHKAALVFAKGRLADYCREHHLPHVAINSLSDVLTPLMQRLAQGLAA